MLFLKYFPYFKNRDFTNNRVELVLLPDHKKVRILMKNVIEFICGLI